MDLCGSVEGTETFAEYAGNVNVSTRYVRSNNFKGLDVYGAIEEA